MLTVISVIIPFFNSGTYLMEALQSIPLNLDKNFYEIIIVDDGSTEELSKQLLKTLKSDGYNVVHQKNNGPAAARNTGAQLAKGEYLLFLDSDNKIRHSYINKSIEILNRDKSIGVVYGKPSFFGDVNEARTFLPRPFDMSTLLVGNYIDICSVVRKEAWASIGGFDENKILSQEDWEFWIRIGKLGWKFHFIPEILYDYRVRNDSHVNKSLVEESNKKMLQYVYTKHFDLIVKHFPDLAFKLNTFEKDKENPIRFFFKLLYHKYSKNTKLSTTT